uniref:RING-type domain-containing protein n=1 Tax=Biomphalaria glabrata TaxID=6526 RepID=A0A2C9KXI5_BIOGL
MFTTQAYLKRLASFSTISQNDLQVYQTSLARNGFYYTGRDQIIECESCKAGVDIRKDRSEIERAHAHSCTFGKVPNTLANEQASQEKTDDTPGAVGYTSYAEFERTQASNTAKESGSLHDYAVSSSKDECNHLTSPIYEHRISSTDSFIDFPDLFIAEFLRKVNTPNGTSNERNVGRECDKNPGHFAYFSLESLRTEQLPSKCRDAELLRLLKLMGDLTVMLTVLKATDSKEKEQWKQGTGFVIEHGCQDHQIVQNDTKSRLTTIPRLNCLSFSSKKQSNYIYIQTSRHLLLNDEEAQKTQVEFSFGNEECKDVVTLKGKYLLCSKIPGDSQCLLVCECTDLRFIQRIYQLQAEFTQAAHRLPLKVRKGMLKSMFMVHHPHGGPKVLSYGDFVQVKYNMVTSNGKTSLVKMTSQEQEVQDVSQCRKVLLYAADTCPGSCGAPLLTFSTTTVDGNNPEGIKPEIWMHNGFETTHKLGASVLKGCTSEDFTRPRADGREQEKDSEDESTLGKQKVNSPVYKVISTPSHPEYILFSARVDSYSNWTFHEIFSPQKLASCGFYYTGEADCVRCFQCGLGLRSWKPGDDVLTQHEKYRPTCPYLKSSPKEEEVSTEASAETNFDIQDAENMELKLLESENTKLKQQLMCKVCFKSEIKDVFLPCGELYACSDCSKLLTHCPSCKKQILATVTVYLT